MFKKVVAPFLICASLAGFSMQANAIVTGGTLVSTRTLQWHCGVDTSGGKGFTGYISGTLKTYSNGRKVVSIPHVRISKSGGQQGGNKANFEMHATGQGFYFDSDYSADNLKQDGTWNNVNMAVSSYSSNMVNNLRIKFTFDKSGSDPSCTQNLAI
ncbi:hypothetical protein ACI77M_08965 [Pseudomonas fildesensis]|uniref:hypothetical protein n=1 Tax=Pseudomonas fildesensis TaxID=1674920 RepID=UPI00387B52E1